jgi:hypothetical protein
MSNTPRKQGFAAMDPERLRQIAAAGGRAKRKYPLPSPNQSMGNGIPGASVSAPAPQNAPMGNR